MKQRLLFSIIITLFGINSSAQTTDTVSIGAGYTNEVWYNLENGTETSVNGSSWDFGFQISGFSAAILANTAYGAELYLYPNGDTSSWANLDTTGMNSWKVWHNPATTWEQGAFNNGLDTSNSLDLGWGKYNFITHQVTGDSLFVWKTASGSIYKVWIVNLSSGSYNFLVSDYNGNQVDTLRLRKSDFTGKNFGYYSIASGSVMDLEPTSNNWDLVFSKYIDFVPTPYSVSGIRTNIGLETAKVYPVNDINTYDSASTQNYSSDINVIGHDWKSFNFGTFSYDIEDSTVYFVKTDTNTYWKLVMKGFGGSADGNFIFEKTKITTTTGLSKNEQQKNGSFLVYPNPSVNRNISIVADLPDHVTKAQLNILNVKGQLVQTEQFKINNSFDVLSIRLNDLESGIYFLHLIHENGSVNRRLVLK